MEHELLVGRECHLNMNLPVMFLVCFKMRTNTIKTENVSIPSNSSKWLFKMEKRKVKNETYVNYCL